MDKALDPAAIASFLHRDWSGLFKAWIQELECYTKQLSALFTEKELNDYERLRHKVVTYESKEFKGQGYNVACEPEALFRVHDIVNLYQQVQRIMMGLEKIRSAITKYTSSTLDVAGLYVPSAGSPLPGSLCKSRN